MATKIFSKQKSLNLSNNSRAYADVILINPTNGQRSGPINCLVDTGSDYTILPLRIATTLNINPPTPASIITSSGQTVSFQSHKSLEIVIEGWILKNVHVLFSPAQQFIPILGRIDLIDTFDFGFDSSYWHFG